jgi:hypothetical protein
MVANNLDSWGSYTGSNFLKVEDVKGDNDAFVVIAVEEFSAEKGNRPRLILGKGDEEWIMDLNVTNSKFCAEKVASPKKLLGKKVYFRKALVMNPSTKKEVESLRISKIE